MTKTFLSWNVNGVRAAERKGFLAWLAREKPYLLGIQESKAHQSQLEPGLLNPPGYSSFWHEAERKGYSGVTVYCQEQPLSVSNGVGVELFDREGRTLTLEYPTFNFINVYVPSGTMGQERIDFKLDFYGALLKHFQKVSANGKPLVVCGDFNTAHREIDLAHPKENAHTSGFLPEERAWLDKFIGWGLLDSLREFSAAPGLYTWWDMRTGARARDVGWRLDYFYVSSSAKARLRDAFILKDVQGSDHCPVGIKFDI